MLDVVPPPVDEDLDGLVIVDPARDSAKADNNEAPMNGRLTSLTVQFVAATNSKPGELDWDFAEQLLERADGIPARVGRTIKNAAASAASE